MRKKPNYGSIEIVFLPVSVCSDGLDVVDDRKYLIAVAINVSVIMAD